jgi:15-cis-phytoene synthase
MNAAAHNVALRSFPSADQVLASKGRSFHWARKFLSPNHARRATQLYQFCRYIDDLADEATTPESAGVALARARDAIRIGHSTDLVIEQAILLFRECEISSEIPLALIEGVTTDLHNVRIHDVEALLQYCFRVAGTVGLMMSHALETHHPAALKHAIDLGMAMQLTNICRDVAADALMNRRYIPSSMLGDISPEALIKPDPALQPQLKRCINELLSLANIYYRSADDGLAYLPLRARYAILIAGRVYGSIGIKLRARSCDYWTERVVVHKSEKIRVTVATVAASSVQAWFWRAAPTHDARIHAAISPLLKQISGHPVA